MEKRGLGRGLSALILGGDSSGPELREIPTHSIVPNPYQPRSQFHEEGLQELSSSLRDYGVLQPVLVRRTGGDTYQLIAGERRLRAAKEAGLTTIPALVRRVGDEELLEVALVENLQREDINPVDAARAYARLQAEFGLTQEAIAGRIGKSQSAIANTMRLLSLPEPIQESVRSREISEGHARALLQAPSEARHTIWRTVVDRSLSVRDTERLAREVRGTPRSGTSRSTGPASAAGRDPHIAAIEEALQHALGTRAVVRQLSHDRGRIEIDFYSAEQFQGILDRILGPAE